MATLSHRPVLLGIALCWALLPVQAQHSPAELDVLRPIRALFAGMYAADSSAVRAAFHPGARLQTVSVSRTTGQPSWSEQGLEGFVQQVGAQQPGVLNERLWHYDVRIDGHLASVWTPYTFFVGDRLSHCGANAFHLFQAPGGWVITHVTDTRYASPCQTTETAPLDTLHTLVDAWHRAAAKADAAGFFGRMAPDGVYIGTDASERWLRDDFERWAEPFFKRGSAWDFTPRERHVYIGSDGRTAWWEELLDTWMGVCRGSGVLRHTPDGGWAITHYHLSVTVPNEKIQGFLKLVQE